MSNLDDVEYQDDRISFTVDFEGRLQNFYLSIALLEIMSGRKIINGKPVALVLFHQYRQSIHRMAIKALKENPGWSEEKPFVLNKSYLD